MMIISLGYGFVSPIAYAADRVALIFQQEDNIDFKNTLYSGAVDAAALHDFTLDVHQVLFSSDDNPKKWFENTVLPKQPKAIIIVEASSLGHSQLFIDEANRKNILVGIINANLNKAYEGVAFRVGSEKSDEGKLAGKYLKKFGSKAPLCVSYLSPTRNDRLRCQGLANGMNTEIYQFSMDENSKALYGAVKNFLEAFPKQRYIVITDQSLLNPLLQARDKANKNGIGNFRIGFVGKAGSGMVDYLLQRKIDFAVHDQPFFQGYWSVSAIAMALTFKLEPQKLVASGPVVIDRDIAQRIKSGQNIVILDVKADTKNRNVKASKRSTYPGVKPLRLKR